MLTTVCAARQHDNSPHPARVMWQNIPLVALLNGFYDGTVTVAEAESHGDFGLGAFASLDGEMVANDGTIYQVKADGKAYKPNPDFLLAYALMIKFQPDRELPIPEGTSLATLDNLIGNEAENQNVFYAIRLTGSFATLQTRSPLKQKVPFPPFCEVTKRQATFNLDGKSGTMVGFWGPAYLPALDASGFHFHFISDDGRSGGHVLAFTTRRIKVEIERVDQMQVDFPRDPSFDAVPLGKIATCK